MAEPEVATKAPESDAAEASTSIIPGDTPAQSGTSLGLGVRRASKGLLAILISHSRSTV